MNWSGRCRTSWPGRRNLERLRTPAPSLASVVLTLGLTSCAMNDIRYHYQAKQVRKSPHSLDVGRRSLNGKKRPHREHEGHARGGRGTGRIQDASQANHGPGAPRRDGLPCENGQACGVMRLVGEAALPGRGCGLRQRQGPPALRRVRPRRCRRGRVGLHR